jgi:hypothetical protein
MQLYFAIGVPTFTVLIGIILGFFQSVQAAHRNNETMSQMNARFTSLESNINNRFSSIDGRFNLMDQDLKMLVRLHNDLDVRLARLEERLAR